MHNISFRSNDCLSDIIQNAFEPKYAMARTKTAKIITTVIEPLIKKEIDTVIQNANFLSIIVDTSNHKATKIMPIVIRTFHPVEGVINKLVQVERVSNEKSETLSQAIIKTVQSGNFENKVVGFCADNTNLNFGGMNRRGTENIWRKLQNHTKRDIFGLGCLAHVAHNAISAGCEVLPVDFQIVCVKLFKHFSIYTVRTENLRALCDELGSSFGALKSHSSVRFLSLEPAIRRVLEMFEVLKIYFANEKKYADSIKVFLNDPMSKFWICFALNQLENFNNTIKAMEKSSVCSFETASELKLMKSKIHNRKMLKYIPHEAKKEFELLNKNSQILAEKKIDEFYDTIETYLTSWETSFDGSDKFDWMMINKVPEWNAVEKSLVFAVKRFGQDLRDLINCDLLFDEFGLIKKYVEQNFEEWSSKKERTESIWLKIFSNFRDQKIVLENLEKLVQFGFCLPGTSTENERIFSLMNNIWTDARHNMKHETLSSILSIQYNSKLECTQFYEKIKSDASSLKKVLS